MRVAVLADIHGNLPALEAVLHDVDAAGVDLIVLNGDLATGPMPAETLSLLESLGERAVWVRGNADREVVNAYDGTLAPDLYPAAIPPTEYAATRISREQRDRLAGLPLEVSLDLDGLGQVRFCHATTRDDTEIVLVDSPVARFAECFPGVEEQVVVLGHTHMAFDRLADRRRFVNPGSVGMPYGTPGAHWALLDSAVTLCRTAYDLQAAAAWMRARAAGYPGIEEFLAENVLSVPSDSVVLEAFGPKSPSQARA